MGVVWAAVNEDTQKDVALKLLSSPDPELRRRLLREAKACGRLEHRNIVAIYDVGTGLDGEPFLVMQLLSGEPLSRRLKRAGRLSAEVGAAIGAATASGLAAAHALGVVHRDLKPDNIFLHREPGSPGDVVKVLDFGISRADFIVDAAGTATGAVLGSPAYMSPEQARGSGEVGPRSDLWALGVVLFEMFAGVRPFPGRTAADALAQVLVAPIPSLAIRAPHLPADLVALVQACLNRDIERRPASASEVAERLLAHAIEEPSGRRSLASVPANEPDDESDKETCVRVLPRPPLAPAENNAPTRTEAAVASSARVDSAPRSAGPLATSPTRSHGSAPARQEEDDDTTERRETAPAMPRSGSPTFENAPPRDEPTHAEPPDTDQTAVLPRGAVPPSPVFKAHLARAGDAADRARELPRSPDVTAPLASQPGLAQPSATASSSTTPLTRQAAERANEPGPAPARPRPNLPIVLALGALAASALVLIVVLVLRGRGGSNAVASVNTAAILSAIPTQAAPAPPPSASATTSVEPEPAPPVASASAPAAEPRGPQSPSLVMLTIQANAPARVFLDDQQIGVTPLVPIAVRPGPHRLRFSHTVLGERAVSIHAKPGVPLAVSVDFGAKDGVSVNPAR